MKKGSQSRKCGHCNQVVMWLIPDNQLGSHCKKIRDFRFRKENPDGSGHYYCMDCLKQMFPNEY